MMSDSETVNPVGAEKPSYQTHSLEKKLYGLYRKDQKPNLSQLGAEDLAERTQFWNNVEQLLKEVAEANGGGAIKRGLTGKECYVNLTNTLTEIVEKLKPKNNNSEPLKKHLAEVSKYLEDLAQLFTEDKQSKLQKKHLTLLATVVAPLHDLIKQLSSRGQVSTDHQVVIQYILAKYARGFGLKKKEAKFCSKVAGDHENAHSQPRAKLLQTTIDQSKENQTIAEGKVLFYLADTFTGVLRVVDKNGKKQLELDTEALVQRFQDILERWNDPLISRQIEPELAILAYQDYKAAIKLLEQYAVTAPKDALLAVLETAVRSFEGLISSFEIREKDRKKLSLIDQPHRALPTISVERFEQVIAELRGIAQAERATQKEVTLNLLISRLENLSRSLTAGPASAGGRIARAVQKSYEIVNEVEIVPDEQAIEIDVDDYSSKVEEKFQAFNLISVATATNLAYHYLQSPLHQETILQFFEQNQNDELSIEKIQENSSLLQLTEELAAQLHNQYSVTLGDGKMWNQLDTKDREKKEKSYIVAMQLLRNIFDYLKDTDLSGILILPLKERNTLRGSNFTNDKSDIKSYLESTDAEAIARTSHDFWRAAKLQEDPKAKVLKFDELEEGQDKKSKAAAAVALENIIRDLSKENSLTKPLHKLSELIAYLFAMIKTPNNTNCQKNTDQIVVNWVEKLTSMGYKTWLMNELSRKGGLNRLTELGEESYFSILTKTREDLSYVQLNDLHLSYKDLDRLPILCAAIALYLDYYANIFTQHSKFLEQERLNLQNQLESVQKIKGIISALISEET